MGFTGRPPLIYGALSFRYELVDWLRPELWRFPPIASGCCGGDRVHVFKTSADAADSRRRRDAGNRGTAASRADPSDPIAVLPAGQLGSSEEGSISRQRLSRPFTLHWPTKTLHKCRTAHRK